MYLHIAVRLSYALVSFTLLLLIYVLTIMPQVSAKYKPEMCGRGQVGVRVRVRRILSTAVRGRPQSLNVSFPAAMSRTSKFLQLIRPIDFN